MMWFLLACSLAAPITGPDLVVVAPGDGGSVDTGTDADGGTDDTGADGGATDGGGEDTSSDGGADGGDTDTGSPPDTGSTPTDADGDGYAEADDCDDDAAGINPGAVEDCTDGADQDCDGAVDCDDDGCTEDPTCALAECWDGRAVVTYSGLDEYSRESGIAALGTFAGRGSICAVSCGRWWASAWLSSTSACAADLSMPTDVDGANLCIEITDPGAIETATCVVAWGGGMMEVTLTGG